jgi:hypothetical protein
MVMRNQSDYWSAWMAGWVSATKSILAAQQRALEAFLPLARRPLQSIEQSLPATAGDKPAMPARRRGRPPKSAAGPTPPRRGRPPKAGRAKR